MRRARLLRVPVQDLGLQVTHHRLEGGRLGGGPDSILTAALDLGPQRVGAGRPCGLPGLDLPRDLPKGWFTGARPHHPVRSLEELDAARRAGVLGLDRYDLATELTGPSLAVRGDVAERLLRLSTGASPRMGQIEQELGEHPGLVVRLLTVLPSRCEVGTVGGLLAFLGLAGLGRWLKVFLKEVSGQAEFNSFDEVLEAARGVEGRGSSVGCHPAQAFLAGLLAGMAATMEVPTTSFLKELRIADELRRGLLHRDGSVGRALRTPAAQAASMRARR